VALGPANRVAVIDGATHVVQKYLLVGQRVWHMAFTPDEKYLLTTNGYRTMFPLSTSAA
jgi:DNA-binding beta-propeller fold protein YncE